MLIADSYSGSLRIASIIVSCGGTLFKKMVICDTGPTLSFVDKDIRDQLDSQGNALTPNIVGTNGRREMASENLGIKIITLNVSESVMFHFHPSMYLGNKSYDYNDLKSRFSHLDFSYLITVLTSKIEKCFRTRQLPVAFPTGISYKQTN